VKKHEKWLYQENAASQGLMFLYILGNTAFIIGYVNQAQVGYALGAFILLNIALLLISFLAAVRQKAYALVWGYAGAALGAIQFLRLAWLPAQALLPGKVILAALLVLSGTCALLGSVLCIKRSQERQNFISENQLISPAVVQR
jgi:hypothetical protein